MQVPTASVRGKDTKYYWGSVDTRWHVYPQRQTVQLIAHNWHGFWCPLPDGRWFKSPISFVLCEAANMDALRGEWRDGAVPMFARDSEG